MCMMYTKSLEVVEAKQECEAGLKHIQEQLDTVAFTKVEEVRALANASLVLEGRLYELQQLEPLAFQSYEELTSCFYDCSQCPYYEQETNGCCMQCEEITGRDYI